MNKKRLIIILCACLAVVFMGIAVGLCFSGVFGNENNEETTVTVIETKGEQVNATVVTENPKQPEKLESILNASGYDFSHIDNRNQLITVTQDEGTCVIECYEKSGGVWENVGITSKAYIGKKGVTSAEEKVEGDYCTPRGLYSLDFAFGTAENPGTKLEYRRVKDGICWVDDSESEYYNQWVDSNDTKVSWNSAEKMWTYDEYIYGAVISYNTDPIVKNKGSAIFLHVGESDTAGCIASDKETIVSILTWLEPQSNPGILIY